MVSAINQYGVIWLCWLYWLKVISYPIFNPDFFFFISLLLSLLQSSVALLSSVTYARPPPSVQNLIRTIIKPISLCTLELNKKHNMHPRANQNVNVSVLNAPHAAHQLSVSGVYGSSAQPRGSSLFSSAFCHRHPRSVIIYSETP